MSCCWSMENVKGMLKMIIWNDNFIMGIEQLDREHKQLFKMAGQILEKVQERYNDEQYRIFILRESITYLHNYFDTHVQQEEAYMLKIQYPGYAMHKALHDNFRKTILKKYQMIIKSGECRKEEVWDFIGTGIGWLLEHIATADLAIVGKGYLSKKPVHLSLNEAALESEINLAITSIFNIRANAKIINNQYAGESFGSAIHHKIVFSSCSGQTTVIIGFERCFVLSIAKMLYGSDIDNEPDLLMSTLDIFDTHFWTTIGRRFIGDQIQFSVEESHFIISSHLQQEFLQLKPTTSILFNSDNGLFYVASDVSFSNIADKEAI